MELMMSVIYKLIAWLLPTSSVDAIVRQLGALASKLAEAEAAQHAKVSAIDADIASLNGARASAVEEAARAARVGAKIGELIS